MPYKAIQELLCSLFCHRRFDSRGQVQRFRSTNTVGIVRGCEDGLDLTCGKDASSSGFPEAFQGLADDIDAVRTHVLMRLSSCGV